MSGSCYTVVPSPELEALLDRTLKEIGEELESLRPAGLAGVVLGGGYGRGEGGVFRTPSGDRLYNDLDFFVFADGAGRRTLRAIGETLRGVSESREKQLGVAVDFSPAKNLSTLAAVGHTLMFQELLRGWKPVWGTVDPARYIPALEPGEIPFTEALRLMLNRGMGLVFAGEKLAAGSTDADFIVRNMNKAVLGCGDALLLAAGEYRWRGQERIGAFTEYAGRQGLPAAYAGSYAEAFRYKFEPVPLLPEDPRGRWEACRAFYMAALRLLAGCDPGAPVSEVKRGIRRRAADARSLKNFLRWLVRTRGIRTAGRLADDPVVSVLELLCDVLAAGGIFPACPPGLYALWRRFN